MISENHSLIEDKNTKIRYQNSFQSLNLPYKLKTYIESLINKPDKTYIELLVNKKTRRAYAILNTYQNDISAEITQKIINAISEYPIYRLCINTKNSHQNIEIQNVSSLEINMNYYYKFYAENNNASEDTMEDREQFYLFGNLEFDHENGENINLNLKIDKNVKDLNMRFLITSKQKLQMNITMTDKIQLLHLQLGFVDYYIYKVLTYLQEYLHPQAKITLDTLGHISKELVKLNLPQASLDIFPLHKQYPFNLYTSALIRSSFLEVKISIQAYFEVSMKEEDNLIRNISIGNMATLLSKRPMEKIELTGENIGNDDALLLQKTETSWRHLFKKLTNNNTHRSEHINEAQIIKHGSRRLSRLSFAGQYEDSENDSDYNDALEEIYDEEPMDSENNDNSDSISSDDEKLVKKIKM